MSSKQTPSGLIIPVDFRKNAATEPAAAPQEPKKSPFERLSDLILGEEHSDVTLMEMIAHAAITVPGGQLCYVFASHARDILHAATDQDLSYSQIILEIYRRTFFSKEHDAIYGGISLYMEDEDVRDRFVSFLETSFATQGTDVSMIKKPE